MIKNVQNAKGFELGGSYITRHICHIMYFFLKVASAHPILIRESVPIKLVGKEALPVPT